MTIPRLKPSIRVIRGRFRKRVFIVLDNGVTLEVSLPIPDALRDSNNVFEAKQIAKYVALRLMATEHIPDDFLKLGVRFTDDEHNEFTFPRHRIVGWAENVLWRFGITLVKPPDWETRKAKVFKKRTKTGKALTMNGRNEKGQFVKRAAWKREG
jgi:hypothetical protein